MSATARTILITGATSGIGKEAAIMLARDSTRVVIVGRDADKTARVLAEVRQRSGSDTVASMLCDFSSQASIRRLAAAFREQYSRLDVLVNNAGGVHARHELTEDGIEATFAVNHLGYFLLTRLLLETITSSSPARIVNVASRAHARATLDFDDLGFAHDYGVMRAYARSKLANVLFTHALAQRLQGSGVTVNALHPGVVGTHIWDHGAPRWARALFRVGFAPVKRFHMLAPGEGARGIVHLAASPEVEGQSGLYFDRERAAEPSDLARDDALAERLWRESERLVGLEHMPRN